MPIVADIKVAIAAAVVKVNALVGQPAEVVLASVDGKVVVSVSELAQIIAAVLCVRDFPSNHNIRHADRCTQCSSSSRRSVSF